MLGRNRRGAINVKVLIILIVVLAAVGTSLFAARQIRRSILSNTSLAAGNSAFANEDWTGASENFQEYLGRNPDDVEVLRKYAESRLAIRPLTAPNLTAAVAAYRRMLRLAPEEKATYDRLAALYSAVANFEELAYVARTRLEVAPDDREAPLWLANALDRLNKGPEARQILDSYLKRLQAAPDKPAEYVRACLQMGRMAVAAGDAEAKGKALTWLNTAADYGGPGAIEALVDRAQFYRETRGIPGVEDSERVLLARKDLEAAAGLSTEDPRISLSLGREWLAHGVLEPAAAALQAAEKTAPETVGEYFVDLDDWRVLKFLLASDLAIRRGARAEGSALADEALAALPERRHRIRALPAAVQLYVGAGKVPEARKYLNEYVAAQYAEGTTAETKMAIAFLQALVARAENRPYAVIDALQPLAVGETSRPEVWRLLAEAYERTDQPRRVVGALVQYLRAFPRDSDMRMLLAREYLKLRDWGKALDTARLAESLNPSEIVHKLLRIEASVRAQADQRQTLDKARLDAVSAELVELRRAHPDRVDIRLLQAAIANYLGQPETVEKELKAAIAECKEPLRAEMELVRHYYGLKRMTEAVDTCAAACKRHPNVAETWLYLSSLYVTKGDYAAARSCLSEGLEVVTDKWEKRTICIRLALVDLMYGDSDAGLRLLSDVAAQDSAETYARSLLLSTRKVREDPNTAVRLLGELRKAEGESGLSWRMHEASLLLSARDWRSRQQDITELLRYCIDSDPEWSAPVLLLAEMYQKLDDSARMEDVCRQALARNPAAVDVADKLVSLLEKQGRFADVDKLLEQIQADPRLTAAWQLRMALRAGDFSRAIDELKVRVSNNERDAESRILLARLVYAQTKDPVEAFRYLKEAESIGAESLSLTAARVAILKAEGQPAEAQRILNDNVQRRQDFAAYLLRARYLVNEKELDRAEQDYRKLTTFPGQGSAGYELLSNFFVRTERLDQAVTAVEEGLTTYPTDLALRRRLMKLLLQRARAQDRAKAAQLLDELEKELKDDPELMKIRALQMLDQPTAESVQAAIEKLEAAVKLEPTAADAHLMLVRIALREGRYEVARDYAIRGIGSNPNNVALLVARSRAELALEDITMAAQLARLALQQAPGDLEAVEQFWETALKDQALREDGTTSPLVGEARVLAEAALARDPQNEGLLLCRSRILVVQKQPRSAIPELEAYCQTEKGAQSLSALATLADLYRMAGDSDRGLQTIERVQRLAPDSQTAAHARFLWLVSQKRFDELAQIIPAYFAAKDPNPQTLVSAGATLLSLNSMALRKEGIRLLEYAVTLAPAVKYTRLTLASGLYQTGDADRAEKIYREILAEDPTDVVALNDLAWVLQEHYQRYTDALALADRGMAQAPGNTKRNLLDTRGTILSNLPDRWADARTDFETLLRLLPETSVQQRVRTMVRLARICTKLNDVAQATKYAQSALEIDAKTHALTGAEREEVNQLLSASRAKP
jgi:tetratricopeptide (TPR) repeat protein